MKRIAPFLVLPVLGLTLLLAGFLWGGRDLRTRLFGEAVPARLPGMWITRAAGSSDLLTSISTECRFTTADGRIFLIHARNHRPLTASGTLPEADFPPHLKTFLDKSLAADIALLRGALRGEARRADDPARIVRVEKIETIHGYLGLPSAPPLLRADAADPLFPIVPADPALAATRGEIRIRAVLDLSDPAALAERRGDSLAAYDYLRAGVATEPAKKNFYLYAEPSSTEFRPVYAYEVDGRSFVRVSHIGRLGGPTLALRLFHDSTVYHDSAAPELGVLIADAGRPEGQYLAWFSRFCEGVFSQWSLTAILMCAGAVMIFVGLLAFSLEVKPSRHLDPA